MENSPDQLKALIILDELVSVGNIKLLTEQLKSSWTSMYLASDLLRKVVKHPYIVIAGKEVNLHAVIRHICQLSQNTSVASWYHILILKPVVEDITYQKEMRCIHLYLLEPAQKLPFYSQRVLVVIGTEVRIRGKVDHILPLE